MVMSTRIFDYVGRGAIGDRPVTLDIGTKALGLYWATDEEILYIWDGDDWEDFNALISAAIGAGINFVELGDTPNDYVGKAGFIVKVNGTEDGLEFTDPTAGGGLPVRTLTADDTLDIDDSDAYVRCNSAVAMVVTVPTDAAVAFPIGTQVTIIQVGDGQVEIAGDTGVTINTAETYKTAKKFAAATLVKVDDDEWDLMGLLEAV